MATTLFAKREEMDEILEQAKKGSQVERESAVDQLAEIARNDSVLLARVEAVKMLGQVDLPKAHESLMAAAKDPQAELRIAAVFACSQNNRPESIQILQEIIGGDSDVDIRLAATRALKNFKGPEAIHAVSLALDDPSPALQLRAADTLQAMTGKNLGHDIGAWQAYVRQSTPGDVTVEPAQIANEPKETSDVLR